MGESVPGLSAQEKAVAEELQSSTWRANISYAGIATIWLI
jgi:hypothetical protein